MSARVVEPRRRDRSREDAWIREYLGRAPWGVLALATPDGPPHVNSNLFVFVEDPDRIYVHTHRTGAMPDATAEGRAVPAAFTAATMGRLLPADEALEFSVEYSGVVVRGGLRQVDDDHEATEALHALLDRYAPHLERGRDYRQVIPAELERTAVYRLDVEEWSGKEKTVGAHEGSFHLEPLPLPLRPPEP